MTKKQELKLQFTRHHKRYKQLLEQAIYYHALALAELEELEAMDEAEAAVKEVERIIEEAQDG